MKHGFYKRKGISGDNHGYVPFLIQRLLCMTLGRTISLLPVFVHTYKRYSFSFVMECLNSHLEDKIPLSTVAQLKGVPLRTLRRWKHSFSLHQEAKHCCLLPGQQIAPHMGFAAALLIHFHTIEGLGELFGGMVKAMIRLWSSCAMALY